MNKVAIIPARGGSKRIPNKNIYNLHGLPLIAYTIRQAIEFGDFDAIYVNSDSGDILKCAEKYGAIPYQRPPELGVDTSRVLDVAKSQIKDIGLKEHDELALLLPTCPLRTCEDIRNAYNTFSNHGKERQVVSMTEYEKAPEQAFVVDSGSLVRQFPSGYSSRSQDHSASYRYNTAIIFSTVKIFLEQSDIVGENSIPYIMPFERSIDIDYQYQMDMVECIMGNTKNISL